MKISEINGMTTLVAILCMLAIVRTLEAFTTAPAWLRIICGLAFGALFVWKFKVEER